MLTKIKKISLLTIHISYAKVEEILIHFPEYDPEWSNRTVFRLVKVQALNPIYDDEVYLENIPLPDVKHDLESRFENAKLYA